MSPGDQLHSKQPQVNLPASRCHWMPCPLPCGPGPPRRKRRSPITQTWSSANSGCVPALEVIRAALALPKSWFLGPFPDQGATLPPRVPIAMAMMPRQPLKLGSKCKRVPRLHPIITMDTSPYQVCVQLATPQQHHMATKAILFHEERERNTHTYTHNVLYSSFHSHRDITSPHPMTSASHFPTTMQLL